MVKPLRRVTDGIERWRGLDRMGTPANRLAHKVIRNGAVKDGLSGTWLGHPVHPLLVAVPIGSWVAAGVLDALPGDNAAAARRLVGLGVLASVPAAATGLSDWSDTAGAEQRVGVLHAGLNLTAIALYTGSWLCRRKSAGAGVVLALAGGVVVACAGHLGGHLAYALGVGIDTNAFQTGPGQWQAVASETEVEEGSPRAVPAAGVSLLILKQAGKIYVLANRCTHRGAPLSDGRVGPGCITCPWHGSVFDLESGAVRRGPATQPQPVYETRVVEGRIQVRRYEPRALRTNSVGSE
ncbi:MAG: (2Fe-2S)-binding protein [Pseudonocardiales bacterium]|nr:MAG: (2Fe-2S)-binding protein [Pseudonocardiales bacterium]